jgi:hypothetical protein
MGRRLTDFNLLVIIFGRHLLWHTLCTLDSGTLGTRFDIVNLAEISKPSIILERRVIGFLLMAALELETFDFSSESDRTLSNVFCC